MYLALAGLTIQLWQIPFTTLADPNPRRQMTPLQAINSGVILPDAPFGACQVFIWSRRFARPPTLILCETFLV